MQSAAQQSVIAELEEAIQRGPSARRVQTLRQVTDLFLNDAARLSEDQVKVFDDVLCLLVARVETRARAELSALLAPNDYAPIEVIQRLARDDEIVVAGSVLAQSTRLRTGDLIEISRTKGQDHLFAISGRANLPDTVTDVILDRGEGRVIRKLAGNAGACFSVAGYSNLVARTDADDQLAEVVGLRTDLPQKLLLDLLQRATEAVRAKLMAIAPAELQDKIRQVMNAIAEAATEADPSARDLSRSEALVRLLKENVELDGGAVIKFAVARQFDEVAAALGILSASPANLIARVLEGPRVDLVLIPCKASGLNWSAAEPILRYRPVKAAIDARTLSVAKRDFEKLSVETAQRTLRFWQLHNRIEK